MSKKSKSIDDRIHEDVLKDFQWNLTSNPKKSLRSFQRVRWTIKGIPNRNFLKINRERILIHGNLIQN